MKRLLLLINLIGLLIFPADLVFAEGLSQTPTTQKNNYFGLPLCLPGMPDDGTCMFYGPAQTVAAMEEAGFSYPPRDLP